MPIDSRWDLRLSWEKDELLRQVRSLLNKKEPTTTREIAKATGCNIEQAKQILDDLWRLGDAYYTGATRDRVWYKC